MEEPGSWRWLMRARWPVGLLAPVVAVALAWLATAGETPIYRATAMLAVVPAAEVEASDDVIDALGTLERRTVVATFARIGESGRTREAAAERIGMEADRARRFRVQSSVVPGTNILRFEATGPDGEGAAELVNAAAAVAAEQVRSMYRIFGMEPLETARAPRQPFHPDPGRTYLIAAAIGLFVGLFLIVGLPYLLPRRTGGA